MKLVEILAKELSEWHDRTERLHQNGDGRIYPTCRKMPKFHKEWDEWDVSGHEVIMNGEDPIYGDCLDLADDYKTKVVTRAQWQAERDRQNGGEWKRHRGGKQPVADDVVVEYKLRNGYTDTWHARALSWSHAGGEGDVMKYRVISQPQAEEVKLSKAEVRAQFMSEPEFVYLEAKTEQIDGPIKWRDTANELDGYIEEFTRERDALIELLASEGFALIPAAVNANPDILPFEEWRVGDVVEVINDSEFCNSEIKVGDHLPIIRVDKSDDTVSVGVGTWSGTESYKFIRRP